MIPIHTLNELARKARLVNHYSNGLKENQTKWNKKQIDDVKKGIDELLKEMITLNIQIQ